MKSLESAKGSTAITTVWWLLGIASTIAMSGGSLWLTSIDEQTRRLGEKAESQGEKISKLEAEQQARWEETKRRLEQIEVKQDRVEQKIDKLLQASSNVRRGLVQDN